MVDDRTESVASTLASGQEHITEHSWPGGWTIRISRAPILKNSDNSASDYSTGAWKRELSMTTVAGQSLPGATFGGNALELLHEASGVRISFTALEALRAWRLLDHEPIPHLASAETPLWDYSFTTPYAGSTSVVGSLGDEIPSAPDGCSLLSRPAADLASGRATLRRPLCQCRGSSGRATLINLCKPLQLPTVSAAGDNAQPAEEAARTEPPPPPPWVPSMESIDIEALLRGVSSPSVVESIDLWRDEYATPHSASEPMIL